MRVTGSGVYTLPAPVPKMPPGLIELMDGLTRDVLKHNPPDVYEFCANHMHQLLLIRDGRAPKEHLTLEQKIQRAQERVRQLAEQRRRKYDEEIKKYFGNHNNEKPEATESKTTEGSNLKLPIHQEQELAKASEVEMFYAPVVTTENIISIISNESTGSTNVKHVLDVIKEPQNEKETEVNDIQIDSRPLDACANEEVIAIDSTITDTGTVLDSKESIRVHENTIESNQIDLYSDQGRKSASLEENSEEMKHNDDEVESAELNEKCTVADNISETDIVVEEKTDVVAYKIVDIRDPINQEDKVGIKQEIDDATVFATEVKDNTDIEENIDLTTENKVGTSNADEIVFIENKEEIKEVIADDTINSTPEIFKKLSGEIVVEKNDKVDQEVEKSNNQNIDQHFAVCVENVTTDLEENVIQNVETIGEKIVNKLNESNVMSNRVSDVTEAIPVNLDNPNKLDSEIKMSADEPEQNVVFALDGYNIRKNDVAAINEQKNNTESQINAIDSPEKGTNNSGETKSSENNGNKETQKEEGEKEKDNPFEDFEQTENQGSDENTNIELVSQVIKNDSHVATQISANEPLSEDLKLEAEISPEYDDGSITTVVKVVLDESAIVMDDNDSIPEQSVSEENRDIMNGDHKNCNEDIFENGNESPELDMLPNRYETSNRDILKDDFSALRIQDNMSVILESNKTDNETSSMGKSSSMDDSMLEESNDSATEIDTVKSSSESNKNMDLETAAITIQKVFRNFLFKSRGSTFEDTGSMDEVNSMDEDNEKVLLEFPVSSSPLNKERRNLGISRMDTVLQTVNEEKSLSLSTDDSSLSSAATIIQAHVRGFLVRNRLNSHKTNSTSLVNSEGLSASSEGEVEQKPNNKTVLNIHIVPEGENFLSRDESLLTSVDQSLDGSPPSSTNLHPLGYDKSEPRKQLKREDAIQSISPPSNNSGKLSEDVDSVKDMLLIIDSEQQKNIDSLMNEPRQGVDIDSRDDTPTRSTTIETVVEAFKITEDESGTVKEEKNDQESETRRQRSLVKLSSDESDVVTPYEDRSPINADNTSQLLHSGEFHDVVLPTKVSRSDTSVVRGE